MKNDINQIAMLLVMVITGTLTLSEEQMKAIAKIIAGSLSPLNGNVNIHQQVQEGETIRGMSELARLMGVSIPTACKISRTGKFDSARLNFGTKKMIWDKAKLLELVKNSDK